METCEVVVIGAGAAGLVAAEELSREGIKVVVIEARPRLGGRIHTVHANRGGREPAKGKLSADRVAVELGAEFIHGVKNDSWPLIEQAGLATQEVPDRHWTFHEGKLKEDEHLWDRLEQAFSKIDEHGSAMTFNCFL